MSGEEIERLRTENAQLRAQLSALEQTKEGRAAAFLRSVLAAVPAFIMRADEELKIRYINQLQPQFTLEDVIGRSTLDFIDPAYHAIARECIERAQETGEPQSYETVAVGAYDSSSYYQTYIAPVTEPDGRRGICFVAMDVSDHKRQQEALRESEQKLRVALAATGIGLWSWDLNSGELIWDERMKEICGRDTPTVLDRYTSELVHPDDRELVEAAGRETFRTGEFVGRPHRIVCPNGEVRWMLTAGRVFKDDDGRPVKLVGGQLDITAQRALEEQLLQAQKMEAVGSLTAGVAHNFNNMLMVILPCLELLREVVPASHESFVCDARDAGQRAAAMVRQLMTFAGQRRTGGADSQSMDELVAAAVRMCRSIFDRHIEIEVHSAPGVPPIPCDPGGIEQVLMNVLLNARDAVMQAERRAPHIRVEVDSVVVEAPPVPDGAPAGRYVRVTVSDEGIGMTDDVRQKIFEPFFTTKGMARGTGLGLASCYAIVRDHNGWIECHSTVGEGSRFSIYLPVSSGVADESAATNVPVEAATEGRVSRLLVVDDEESVRRLVKRALVLEGHDVLCAANANEALDLVEREGDIALVLLDRSMPGAPGHTLIPKLREGLPQAKILYFTGQEVRDAERDRVDGVVAKPVTLSALLSAVRDAISEP